MKTYYPRLAAHLFVVSGVFMANAIDHIGRGRAACGISLFVASLGLIVWANLIAIRRAD